ncbi:MAG: hypothetical protein IPM74_18815 [Crocinitomicaceae bacterium]|nr:hypothetical protein [Crocinitomicaceae bacterium]MBK8927894.1 hypothetical protein [Crocinitomicaceae bacterium]
MSSVDFLQTTKTKETFALVVFALTVIIPALGYNGFLFEFLIGLNSALFYSIVCIGSLLSFFITNYKRVLANLAGGLLTGPGVAFATGWYLTERSSIMKIELVIPMFLGGLPGVLVYFLIVKFSSNRSKNTGKAK